MNTTKGAVNTNIPRVEHPPAEEEEEEPEELEPEPPCLLEGKRW